NSVFSRLANWGNTPLCIPTFGHLGLRIPTFTYVAAGYALLGRIFYTKSGAKKVRISGKTLTFGLVYEGAPHAALRIQTLTRDLQKCTSWYTKTLYIPRETMGCLQTFIPHRSRSRAVIPHSSPQVSRKFGFRNKGHKGKRRHPAFRCAQIGLSLGIAEALAGTVVSLRSTVPVHPLARAPYRPGLDSRWGSIPPGSAPAPLRSVWLAAAAGRGVAVAFRWASSRVSRRLRRRRAAVSLPSRLICPRSRGHVRSRRRELRPSFNPAADFLQPCRARWICPLRICSAMPST